MRWYRYVETAEWLDIRRRGHLSVVGNSCGPGKWIARREEQAWEWGRLLDPRFPGRVVVLEVEASAIANACPGPGILDGIGEAAYIQPTDLEAVSIVEIVEYAR